MSEKSSESSLATTSGKDHDAKTPQYIGELRSLYGSLTATKTSDNQWPPPCTRRVFNLALIKEEEVQRGQIKDRFVRMTITGKLDDILRVKYPVTLENIFKDVQAGKRRVVLIEGAPGCGKSTLSIFISQQWGEHKLFNEYKVVILVRLRDPVVQKAESILDLIPTTQLESIAQQAEKEMRANLFQDVLFILDGWDELPVGVRENPESIFRSLIQEDIAEKNGLHKSAVIVTSRPVASGELQKIVSARVEVLGFTPEELTDYFSECLEGDAEAVATLKDRIEENPAIAGTCYLPLNASILVHLFKYGRRANLPTSQYGVFSLLVCTCIQRHLKERTQHKSLTLESLDQLAETEGVSEPFKYLCQLAYDGVMNDRITFSSLPDNVNTLSLLQGVESFVKHTEKVMSYNFTHLSIQELLASFFMVKWLPADEQVNKFNELFKKPRFIAVFKFYSAITKLQTPGISEIITRVAKRCSEEDPDEEVKVLLVSLFHCLNEAQDPSLCKLIKQYLDEHGLNLGHTTLNQTDCLSIGYFLSYACSTTSSTNLFKANLFNCNIGDEGCKYLAKGMLKCLDKSSEVTKTTLHLNLRWNGIHKEGSFELCRLIKSGCIKALVLNGNEEFSDDGAYHIAQALEENTTLKELSLYTCGLKSEGLGYIAQGLKKNNTLTMLNIGGNGLYDEGIGHLAHALKDNQGLTSLNLSSCGMTDTGLSAIAESLQKNDTLTDLKLFNFQNQPHLNELTDGSGALKDLTETLKKNPVLLTLALPRDFESSVTELQEAVNETRALSGAAPITVEVSGHTLARIKGIEAPVEETEQLDVESVEDERESSPEVSETSSTVPSPVGVLSESNLQSGESDFNREASEVEEEAMEMDTERDYSTVVEQLSPPPLEVNEEEPFATATQAKSTQAESTNAQPSDTDLRGVEVCAKTTVVVTNSKQSFVWEGYGLKLHFQEGCLPEGIEECVITLQASIAGEYKFPENNSLVSAIFWLRPEPRCRFALPISMEIQHCAKQENTSKLGFVKAFCTQQDLPYSFRRLSQSGRFYRSDSDNKSYGVLELNSFSAVGVTQESSEDREYAARVFYLSQRISHEIHMVVTWDVEAHRSVVMEEYTKDKQVSKGPEQQVEFESTEIKLDLPMDGTKLKEGWEVTPLISPVIQKKKVDNYMPGKVIPKFHLLATFIKKEKVPTDTFLYQVNLIGAKEPFNMFKIHPPAPAILPKATTKSRKSRLIRQLAMQPRRLPNRKVKSMEDKGSTSKGLCDKMKSNSFGEVESSGGVTGNVKRGCKTAKSGRYQNEDQVRCKGKKRKRTQSSSTETTGRARKTACVLKPALSDDREQRGEVLTEESEEEMKPQTIEGRYGHSESTLYETDTNGSNPGMATGITDTEMVSGTTSEEEEKSCGEEPLYSLEADAPETALPKPHKGTPQLKCLEDFATEVAIILHTTVSPSEKPAVLKDMTAPKLDPPVTQPINLLVVPNTIILGMFGGYKCALVQTEQGEKCKKEIEDALKHLPNTRCVIALGMAYGSTEYKFGDVLVSKTIRGVVNPKFRGQHIDIRSSEYDSVPVLGYLSSTFARDLHNWKDFQCSTAGRISKVHAGDVVSVSWLISSTITRDKLLNNFHNAIGGEMEGHELVKIQKEYNEKNHPRQLGVIIIKGAADYADENKQGGKKWQYTAARAATSFAKHKLEFTNGALFESTEVPCVNKSPSFGGVGQKGEVFTEEECEDKGKKQSPNIENTDKNGDNTNGEEKHEHGESALDEAAKTTESQLETAKQPTIDKKSSTSTSLAHPTSRSLTLIEWRNKQGKKETFQLKQQICHKWKDLGCLLEVPFPVLFSWEKDLRDQLDCTNKTLCQWMEHPTDNYPNTWEGLYHLLEQARLSQVAEDLKRALANAL